ncbi:hydrogenase expression/formation protein HypE [Saccharopolyspora gloriosae]|uniref:hydrogenase expression/formation protein HypE n=1 Tax=Saccharopolyspora gloriosae TaxID=455344 RepID=UPI001FB59562|nr:hydrogenase expression/formation protein HypE [Saccharopolyspora gloriosae]
MTPRTKPSARIEWQEPRVSRDAAQRDLIESMLVEFCEEPPEDASLGRIAVTTDSFAMAPLFFPGGNIGDLAVHGTVNDLAVSGATPRYLVVRLVVEDGFPVDDLRRVARSIGNAAGDAGMRLVSGGADVVAKGEATGCRIDTTGVGTLNGTHRLGVSRARPGDAVLVTGPVGDHGVAVLLGQDDQSTAADVVSDTAALHGLAEPVLAAASGVRALRCPARGGVAAVLDEITRSSGTSMALEENAIPVRARVRTASELLNIDPLHVACAGRAVVVVDGAQAQAALTAMRSHPLGERAAIIGRITAPDVT